MKAENSDIFVQKIAISNNHLIPKTRLFFKLFLNVMLSINWLFLYIKLCLSLLIVNFTNEYMINMHQKSLTVSSIPGIVTIGEEKKICTASENFLRMCESTEVNKTMKSFVIV